MTLFTQIFDMATSSVSRQRAISELDQRSRQLSTMLRNDLSKRTFRYVFPYRPFEDPTLSPTPFGSRAGYIYISTNDPYSGQDNLLQFTVDARMLQETSDATEFFGAAAQLVDSGFTGDPRLDMIANPNQPDADDGSLSPNGVSASPAAEISYFIRNGNLYRRVMLLRNPLPVAGEDLAVQPYNSSTSGPYLVAGSNNFTRINQRTGLPELPPTDDFWTHFDFSAVPVFDYSSGSPVLQTAAFVGVDSLSNEPGTANSLGIPGNRFGFNLLTGLSREHDRAGATRRFIGRFLQAETSSPNFNWPIALSALGNGNPMDLAAPANAVDLQSNGVVQQLATPSGGPTVGIGGRGGGRAVEDLLLADVHEFSVEVWDDRLERYVTPANNFLAPVFDPSNGNLLDTVQGDLHFVRRANTTYGPLGSAVPAANRVFDTWNPGSGGAAPPLRPLRYYPPRSPDGPSPASMRDPSTEVDAKTMVAANRGYWEGSDFSDPMNPILKHYVVGDVVFAMDQSAIEFRRTTPPPSRPSDPPDALIGWDYDGDGTFNWSADQMAVPKMDSQIAYRCISNGISGDLPPTWSSVPGQRFAESVFPGGVPVGETPAVWEAVDNRRPIKSLRLKIQFVDPKSEGLRPLTLILPLTSEQ